MSGDNFSAPTYDEFMAAGQPYIVLKLDTKNPIELGDFVNEFTSVSSQYEKFIKEQYPDLAPQAQVYVKEVKEGSIVAELLPYAPFLVLGAPQIATSLEHINAVNDFVKHYGEKLKTYLTGSGKVKDATRSDLKDFMDSVQAIANDTNGKGALEAVVYEDGKKKIRAAIKFNTKEAQRAVERIEKHREQLEHKGHADHERVLMVFTQANIKNPPVGKRTGEWVRIEGISDRELPLIYASELAEQRIKHEVHEAKDNLFKKGFIVDVNVETRGGRPVAFRVTNVHQIIDLPDDDSGE